MFDYEKLEFLKMERGKTDGTGTIPAGKIRRTKVVTGINRLTEYHEICSVER